MIRINKSPNIPAILTTQGQTERLALEQQYQANPQNYTSAPNRQNRSLSKFSFEAAIYGDASVKDQLKHDQHDKCCFCEAKFSDNSFGDVEHFRPKGAYKRTGARTLTFPGYYWLAYDWENLMYSCEKCNRSYKKNHFPLSNEATRKPYHNHLNPLSGEATLLVNPYQEDPTLHIGFREEQPIPLSPKGQSSIAAYGLERLNDSRLTHLTSLEIVLKFCNIDLADQTQINAAMVALRLSQPEIRDLVDKANQLYNSAARDSAKYASCVRCKFPYLPT